MNLGLKDKVVLCMASVAGLCKDNAYISGQTILLDGSMTRAY